MDGTDQQQWLSVWVFGFANFHSTNAFPICEDYFLAQITSLFPVRHINLDAKRNFLFTLLV